MPQPTVTKRFRNPRALSSALASLGTLQPWALGFLNRLVTLVSAYNFYVGVALNIANFLKLMEHNLA